MENGNQKIWRVISKENYNSSYVDQLKELNEKVSLTEERSAYSFPKPESDLDKHVYEEFQRLLDIYLIHRPDYVMPLIKEFVIDNREYQAAFILRYQMDLAAGKGFQMKEMVYHIKGKENADEVYENHKWFFTGRETMFLHNAKTHLDPMLLLLKASVYMDVDVNLYNLDLKKDKISFIEGDEDKSISLNKRL